MTSAFDRWLTTDPRDDGLTPLDPTVSIRCEYCMDALAKWLMPDDSVICAACADPEVDVMPECPSCGAIAELLGEEPNQWLQTEHDPDCLWMANPDAERYD